jgi:RNA polymerase sigma-70 factor, ECF subfamily
VALTEIDRKLLSRCLVHEPDSWRDFVDRFMGLFVHVIQHTAHTRSVPLSSEDVDDLCAEIFVRLVADDFAVLRRFRGNSSLATYLAVVSRRIVVREIASRRMAEALGHVNAHRSSLGQAKALEAGVHEKRVDSHDEVRGMLEHLPPGEAEIVKQFHIEGKSYREISSGLGIPENTIGPTLSRARAKLRDRQVQP